MYPGFDMFMLTTLNTTNDKSNNKYMGRYNVHCKCTKGVFLSLKHSTNLEVIYVTAPQCKEL